jgi:hypothetical protein
LIAAGRKPGVTERHGWEVVEVFEDNNAVSGAKGT